jgi:cytochrome c oxidase subunit 3
MMRTVASDNAMINLQAPLVARKGIVGMWVALGSILMMFTALTSAYIVRTRLSDDWRPLWMPHMLWLSTALILVSSITFEVARSSLKKGREQAYSRWLLLTVLLGLGFLAAQFLSWRQLVAQGIYLDSNPHSSFFYLLTGVHGLHLLGGILALDYLLLRNRRQGGKSEAREKRQVVADVVGIYWHFLDGLWVYLFLLLFFWR